MRILMVNCFEWGSEQKRLNYDDVGQWIIDAFVNQSIHFDVWRAQREMDMPISSYDGVVIGGSASSVYEKNKWIQRLSDKITAWANHKTPLLGICFGHQIIAQALGGVVEKNHLGWEIGLNPLELTEAGKSDPIFAGFNSPNKVMQSHQDIVTVLPPGGECLASSPKCALQSFRIGDRIRSVQFHPEYTVENMIFLLGTRRERLAACGVDFDATIKNLEPLPETRNILSNFITYFVQKRI